jgi:hypothetical protein
MFAGLWTALWQADPLQNPLYSPLGVLYSREYARDCQFEDLSFVVEEGQQPLLGVQMSLETRPDGSRHLTGFGRPILFLQSPAAPKIQVDGAWKVAKPELDRLLAERPVATIVYRNLPPTLSPFGRYLLEMGAAAAPFFTLMIDLSPSKEELHQHVRKSYRSLINWGKRQLAIRILDADTIQDAQFERFRQLHVRVAGRETRSRRSWDLQCEMVRNGEAFVVFGELDGELVTASLYLHSPKLCYYGVSAADRNLFDKPLSHAVLWTGIVHAKQIGCAWMEVGEQILGAPAHRTPKEAAISDFKRGFGGQTQVQLDVVWTANIREN